NAVPSIEEQPSSPEPRNRGRESAPSQSEENQRRLTSAATTDIAIIGMSGRFPEADNVHEFWSNLAGGKNSISEIPTDRWDHRKFYDPSGQRLDKTSSKWGG